ncbi:MAG: AAA family ATPase [Spirochaetia bacterium]|nr:AAA family ATPase [Spirochaetia bacterium]
MFLKSIELFGFKSFAERSKLEFSSGITALLGPNGCGKSNIVDSIKWVLGEQSIKTLRAGKMEDVIFNGTETRKKLNVAEVVLVISNEAGYLPMDVSEIAIKRRVYRSGESEYFINNTPVRLREVKELFFDTGIGKSSYSILEQGKIDQILSQKPEDRRYIFEEAAGITRFKQKSLEANRKLDKTEENLRQVQGILKEVKHTYDTRRVQAEKAEKHKRLQQSIFELEVFLQLSRVAELNERRRAKIQLLHDSADEYAALQQKISLLNDELESSLDQVNTLSNDRMEIQNRLHRIDESKNSKKHQMDLFYDRVDDFDKSIAELTSRCTRIEQRIARDTEEIDQKSGRQLTLRDELDTIEVDITTFLDTISTAEERISRNAQEGSEAEDRIRELEASQLTLRRDLQQITEYMVTEFDAGLRDSGFSFSGRRQLEQDIRDRLAKMQIVIRGRLDIFSDSQHAGAQAAEGLMHAAQQDLLLLQQALTELESLYLSYAQSIPSFIDDFLSPAGTLNRKRGIDENIEKNYDDIEDLRLRVDEIGTENTSLRKKLQNYRETLEHLRLTEVDLKGRLKNIEDVLKALFRSSNEQETALEEARNDLQGAIERHKEAQERIEALKKDSEDIGVEEQELTTEMEQLKERVEAIQASVAERRKTLSLEQELVANVSQRIERTKAEIDALESETDYIYTSFEENYSKSLAEYDGRIEELTETQQVYRSRLKQLKQQMVGLGYINHMASEEFAEVKERYEFLKKQMTDLETAKHDLVTITTEIRRRSEELFEDCYLKIKRNFHIMFRRLFGGGRAELRLVDPNDILNSGIDILAQPPGKKLEKISLLSGGERSMTAVALLFATYLVKPSPFCILDEIDAALDDANIGYFLDVLHDFSEKSQFIIITHNKRTVLGSSTLLGVTMQEAGISKAIAYRLGEEPDKASIYE